jgi:glyoxylase-like metal-dependent hydrolase (beta-lactamase superfamily II)
MSDVKDGERLYFRQLLSGRDFARGDQMARQMVNFVYLIGDRATGEAVIVDPAYAVGDLLDIVEADGMTLTGVLATHYHPDHVGGEMRASAHCSSGCRSRSICKRKKCHGWNGLRA